MRASPERPGKTNDGLFGVQTRGRRYPAREDTTCRGSQDPQV